MSFWGGSGLFRSGVGGGASEAGKKKKALLRKFFGLDVKAKTVKEDTEAVQFNERDDID